MTWPRCRCGRWVWVIGIWFVCMSGCASWVATASSGSTPPESSATATPAAVHKYAYAHNNPVNRIDPSGHMSLPDLSTAIGNIGVLASRVLPAIGNARWMAYARLTPVIERGWQTLFSVDAITTTVGAAAIVGPEVLNLAADLGTQINRAYSLNTTDIPAAPGRGPNGQLGYGLTIENIGGQQLEAMGGKCIGGRRGACLCAWRSEAIP